MSIHNRDRSISMRNEDRLRFPGIVTVVGVHVEPEIVEHRFDLGVIEDGQIMCVDEKLVAIRDEHDGVPPHPCLGS